MIFQSNLKLFILIITISMIFSCSLFDRKQAVPSAQTAADSEITVQFITEEGKPLLDGRTTLIESKGDEFIRAHFRDSPLKTDGTMSLPSSFLDLPIGSVLFVRSSDEFYFHSFEVSDIKKKGVSDGKIALAVPKTGIITATIIDYEKGIEQPLVIPVLKLNKDGVYEEFRGIGIGLSNNYPFSIAGLPEGTYRIEVKKNYEDSTVYYRKDGIRVIEGQKMDLGDIKLSIK